MLPSLSFKLFYCITSGQTSGSLSSRTVWRRGIWISTSHLHVKTGVIPSTRQVHQCVPAPFPVLFLSILVPVHISAGTIFTCQ
jgi:hypothetical protein